MLSFLVASVLGAFSRSLLGEKSEKAQSQKKTSRLWPS
jgi:hypothetical protein